MPKGAPMRFPKPFFRASKNSWYVQFGKKQRSLGTADEAEALEAYKKLLADEHHEPLSDRRTKIYQCFELFLEHSQENHAERSYLWYKATLQNAHKSFGTVRLSDLKPFHVTRWLKGKTL